MSELHSTVTLIQEENYRFRVELDPGEKTLIVDEPPPLGKGEGPNPFLLLLVAVGHCLSSSLNFCVRKVGGDPHISTRVEGELYRNPQGRLRVKEIQVEITFKQKEGTTLPLPRQRRCLELFEDYCIVTQSVRAGIPVFVRIRDYEGMILYESKGTGLQEAGREGNSALPYPKTTDLKEA